MKDVLQKYLSDVAAWRERGASYMDIKPLDQGSFMLLRMKLHPTNRSDAKHFTKVLIEYLSEHRIAEFPELQTQMACSNKTLLNRLRILRESGMIRRLNRRYYVATPRMDELIERDWLKRLVK